jgi:uncharacterized protein YecE (DUF72 family)
MKPVLRVGTSGWSYGEWDRIFYPEGVRATQDRLAYYAGHFNTVEVNYSFYHLPKVETYRKWAGVAPDDFLFAIKASRYITHIRRLSRVGPPWDKFINGACTLGKRLGPVLFQFPPGFPADARRLSRFLIRLKKTADARAILPVFEFRHRSWFARTIYSILEDAGATLCIAHSSKYPCVEQITSDLVYFRFHGPRDLFASRYSNEELQSWAKRIRPRIKDGKTVFVYFNNTFNGYAIENAKTLRGMIE